MTLRQETPVERSRTKFNGSSGSCCKACGIKVVAASAVLHGKWYHGAIRATQHYFKITHIGMTYIHTNTCQAISAIDNSYPRNIGIKAGLGGSKVGYISTGSIKGLASGRKREKQ